MIVEFFRREYYFPLVIVYVWHAACLFNKYRLGFNATFVKWTF